MATLDELTELMMAKEEAEEREAHEDGLMARSANMFVCETCGGLHMTHFDGDGDAMSTLCIDTPEHMQQLIDSLVKARDAMLELQAAQETKQ